MREEAWLDLPDRMIDERGRVFGPPIAKLTPERHYLLLGHNNPILWRGACTRGQVYQALWFLSPAFRVGMPFARLRFLLFQIRWALLFCGGARGWLTLWLEDVFSFRLPTAVSEGGSSGAADSAEWIPHLMLAAHRRFGIGSGEAFRTPYVRLWPLFAAALGVDLPDLPKFDPKRDRKKSEFLRRRRARLAAKAERSAG